MVLLLLSIRVENYRKTIVVFTLAMGVFHIFKVLPYWLKSAGQKVENHESYEKFNIFYANINSQNVEKEKLIKYLEKARPSIALLLEVNSSWAKELKKIKEVFPYTKAIVQEGNFGIAILSQSLIKIKDVFVDRENQIPALFVQVTQNGVDLNVLLLHAHPPLGKYATIVRDQYLEMLAQKISEISDSLLVCGDFNSGPWTSIFESFLSKSQLQMGGVVRSWPEVSVFPKLPIDHCLAKGVEILQYEKGPRIGSDHRPLLVQLTTSMRGVAGEINP
ncbi:MAG: endonuclease/exonuclease/phosphatase family protein [Bdellovibrionales bacterium]|nr:endonuclease/exonuclease/phosphatase family protein [Bdellovibrionales bacterium]